MADLVFIMNRPEPCRAELFLRKDCGVSHRQLTRLKHIPGGMTVNGNLLRSVDILYPGDCIRLHTVDVVSAIVPNADLKVPLVFEDADVWIFDKPPGMPVHPSQNHHADTLGNAFAAQFPGRTFRPVNRLDKDTSGLIPVAKHPLSAMALPEQIQKTYLAIVSGNPPEVGTVTAPLGRMPDSVIVQCVRPDGKRAVTHFRVLQRGHYTLLEIHLETGRTHQIRVHMAHIGCPLAGDALYGGNLTDLQRHALHCAEIAYTDQNHILHTVTSPLPDDLQSLLQ